MGTAEWGQFVTPMLALLGTLAMVVVTWRHNRATRDLGIAASERDARNDATTFWRDIADVKTAECRALESRVDALEERLEARRRTIRAQGDYIDRLRRSLCDAGIDPGPRPTDI